MWRCVFLILLGLGHFICPINCPFFFPYFYFFFIYGLVDVTENPNISMEIQKNLHVTGEVIQQSLDQIHKYFDKTSLN